MVTRRDDPALYRAAERLLAAVEADGHACVVSRRRALRLIREAILSDRTARLWRWTKDCASIHRKDRTEIARLRRLYWRLRCGVGWTPSAIRGAARG